MHFFASMESQIEMKRHKANCLELFIHLGISEWNDVSN